MAQLSSLTGRCAPLQSNRVAARPARRSGRVACSALPPSPPGITFGCHAQVWCGDWQKADIENAVQGSKKAGFDLVEGEPHTAELMLHVYVQCCTGAVAWQKCIVASTHSPMHAFAGRRQTTRVCFAALQSMYQCQMRWTQSSQSPSWMQMAWAPPPPW